MKMVYTAENRFIVANAKNILESNGIDVVLRNEYTSSGVGELSPFDTWPEVWVTEDADYDRAVRIIGSSLSEKDAVPWICANCGEENDASFEVCWNCQKQNS